MDKNTKNTAAPAQNESKILSKPRIFFGILLIVISAIMAISFASYLINWKADQSQAGTMLDKSIKSSNIFGKIGDWLGKVFIFDSIGVAAFIVAFLVCVFGLLILKKKYFKPWKTISHSLFFICWLPIFFGAITKGVGTLSGVYGFQIIDFLSAIIGDVGLWVILIVSIALYFILEFNMHPSAIKQKFNDINEATVGRVKSMMPSSDENFEADNELEEMANDGNEASKEEIKTQPKPAKAEAPKGFPNVSVTNELETISTPNKTSFDTESAALAATSAAATVLTTPAPSVSLDVTDSSAPKTQNLKSEGDNFDF